MSKNECVENQKKNQVVESAEITHQEQGLRLDQAVSLLFSQYSRAQLQKWIKTGELTVNGQQLKPKHKVKVGDTVMLSAELVNVTHWMAEKQALDLDIVYEDEHLLVVNKSANCVVHPAHGHASGTLVNALLEHCPSLSTLPRAGLIHRLDKDTTGLLVVAKTLQAHHRLVQQMQAREIRRIYWAVIQAVPLVGGAIRLPIGRHPRIRTKMAVINSGRPSVTHYKVVERFALHTLLKLKLETGRTHQIRVHLSHQSMPILGDALYGTKLRLPKGIDDRGREILSQFKRQALHATELSFDHPIEANRRVHCQVPLPSDMSEIIEILRSSS
jgi:23S rRNA pseudouridine1911/1915/1917 synthase